MTYTGLFLIGVAISIVIGLVALFVTWKQDARKQRRKEFGDIMWQIMKKQASDGKIIHLDKLDDFCK